MSNIVKEAAEEWLKKALPIIKQDIRNLEIKSSGKLTRRVKGSIDELTKGYTYKASIKHEYYGIFTHYGVGKGVTKEDDTARKLSGRKKKPWLESVSHEGYVFQEIIGKKITDSAQNDLAKKITNKITLKL